MRALILEGKGTLKLREVEDPTQNDNYQLIKVEAVSIGGSEYLGFNNPGIRPLPNIMGHGISGTTLSGKRVAIYPLSGCGKCYYCLKDQIQLCDGWSLIGVQTNGGFAQKVSVPKESTIDLPDTLSWEQSVFIEPFANSINAWEISEANKTDSIAIIGAGSLGLGLVASAKKSGCKSIHIGDLSTNRRNAAEVLGATETSKQLKGQFDIVFDTVGSIETRDQTIQSTKKGGKCIFQGFETPEHKVNMSEIIRHQKQLIGSFVYSKSHFNAAITLAENCKSTWVRNISFEEVEGFLVRFLNYDFKNIKVALRPNNIKQENALTQ